ncbi:MAG: hypothetical protein Q9185_002154 [Variospora sp. 1 TL-2023]
MVTVTQMSMQTATAVSIVTQMQTITVPGTCAVSMQPIATPSSPDVVTAGALNQVATSASVAPIASNSGAIARASDSTATPAAAAASTVLSEQPCDCSCLCQMAAFPMAAYQKAANTTQAATSSTVQSSTFQTVVSASVANKVAASFSVRSSPPASSVAVTSPTSSASTSDSAAVATSTPGVLPSNIVTDPGIPTGRPEIQDAQDAALNIGTYQLMKSVALPVVIDQTIRSTATVHGNRS